MHSEDKPAALPRLHFSHPPALLSAMILRLELALLTLLLVPLYTYIAHHFPVLCAVSLQLSTINNTRQSTSCDAE